MCINLVKNGVIIIYIGIIRNTILTEYNPNPLVKLGIQTKENPISQSQLV